MARGRRCPVELVTFPLGPASASVRYGLLARLHEGGRARDVRLLGFSVGHEVRVLLEGPADAVRATVTAAKVGTARASGGPSRLGPSRFRTPTDGLTALVDLHREPGPDGPLGNPWTSHRDLLGFRTAPFFDRRVWAGRIDPRRVHVEAGGGPLPFGWPPDLDADPADLGLVLRVAGAVLGVLPADRACFRLFAHMTRALGVRQLDVAAALSLTPRRIRQLVAQPEPALRLGLLALSDPRLSVVP